MKKLLLATAFTLVGATAAQAQINIELGNPGYVEPAYVERPVVVEHPAYYNDYGHGHHTRHYDYSRWNHPVPHAEPHPVARAYHR